MKRIWYLIVVTLAWVLAGCDDEPGADRQMLLRAEYFIDTWQLDSAEAVMGELRGRRLPGREDSALYALNFMRLAKVAGHEELPDDAMAAMATAFYDGANQPHRAMLAWYHRACMLYDSRHYMEAMSAMGRMKPYAEQLNDYLHLSRYGDLLGHCYEISDKNREAARHYTYAFRQFLNNEPDNAGYLKYFSTLATKAWLRAGYVDSALVISNTMKPLVLALKDTSIVSSWISSHATMLLDERVQDYEGAAALYDEVDSLHVPYWPGAANHRIARLLIKSGLENDTAAWNEAMALIDKYGVESLSFGYRFHGATAPDQLEMHSDIYIDPATVLPSLSGWNEEPDSAAGDVEASVADSPVTHIILGVLLGVVALAALVVVRRRGRK